ncbi:transposase [Atopobium sp. oral taxon 416]|uniref:transposase n=1 Tax=Atopobium sp. oral taxon 416 TaxID=712157 RepID=UPI001BA83023|nr:transposase [Atopobium sp. oral taxon 416]QUC03997.1 transposase [Atopobium sp. oral taxon 416]
MPQLKVVPKIRTEQMYERILQMFSYENKKSAIELYYKCGRRVAPLINELGYPDRHALYNWVKDYEMSGAISEDGRSKGIYTEEQKCTVVV